MECGHWIARVEVAMMDLSHGSAKWWQKIKESAEGAYQEHIKASPIKKLEVAPELEDRKKYVRLRAKATGLALEAIPKSLADELVSARETHPIQVLRAVMKKFQPGGLEERNQLLIRLEEVASCANAEDAVKELVVWERMIKRAEELKLVIQDSSRLMSALMKMVKKSLSVDSQLAF